jgi:hypothetical protein
LAPNHIAHSQYLMSPNNNNHHYGMPESAFSGANQYTFASSGDFNTQTPSRVQNSGPYSYQPTPSAQYTLTKYTPVRTPAINSYDRSFIPVEFQREDQTPAQTLTHASYQSISGETFRDGSHFSEHILNSGHNLAGPQFNQHLPRVAEPFTRDHAMFLDAYSRGLGFSQAGQVSPGHGVSTGIYGESLHQASPMQYTYAGPSFAPRQYTHAAPPFVPRQYTHATPSFVDTGHEESGRHHKKNNFYCNYCHRPGHTVDRCWLLGAPRENPARVSHGKTRRGKRGGLSAKAKVLKYQHQEDHNEGNTPISFAHQSRGFQHETPQSIHDNSVGSMPWIQCSQDVSMTGYGNPLQTGQKDSRSDVSTCGDITRERRSNETMLAENDYGDALRQPMQASSQDARAYKTVQTFDAPLQAFRSDTSRSSGDFQFCNRGRGRGQGRGRGGHNQWSQREGPFHASPYQSETLNTTDKSDQFKNIRQGTTSYAAQSFSGSSYSASGQSLKTIAPQEYGYDYEYQQLQPTYQHDYGAHQARTFVGHNQISAPQLTVQQDHGFEQNNANLAQHPPASMYQRGYPLFQEQFLPKPIGHQHGATHQQSYTQMAAPPPPPVFHQANAAMHHVPSINSSHVISSNDPFVEDPTSSRHDGLPTRELADLLMSDDKRIQARNGKKTNWKRPISETNKARLSNNEHFSSHVEYNTQFTDVNAETGSISSAVSQTGFYSGSVDTVHVARKQDQNDARETEVENEKEGKNIRGKEGEKRDEKKSGKKGKKKNSKKSWKKGEKKGEELGEKKGQEKGGKENGNGKQEKRKKASNMGTET